MRLNEISVSHQASDCVEATVRDTTHPEPGRRAQMPPEHEQPRPDPSAEEATVSPRPLWPSHGGLWRRKRKRRERKKECSAQSWRGRWRCRQEQRLWGRSDGQRDDVEENGFYTNYTNYCNKLNLNKIIISKLNYQKLKPVLNNHVGLHYKLF